MRKVIVVVLLALVMLMTGCQQSKSDTKNDISETSTKIIETETQERKMLKGKGISDGFIEYSTPFTEWEYSDENITFTLYRCTEFGSYVTVKKEGKNYFYTFAANGGLYNERSLVYDEIGTHGINCEAYAYDDLIEIVFSKSNDLIGDAKTLELKEVTDSIPKNAVLAYLRELNEKNIINESYKGKLLSATHWELIESDGDLEWKMKVYGDNEENGEWEEIITVKKDEDKDTYDVYEDDQIQYKYKEELNESECLISKIEKDNSKNLFQSALWHYIEDNKLNEESEFYQLKDYNYSRIGGNQVQETIMVLATTQRGKKYSKKFKVKKEQNSYFVVDNGALIYEYMSDTNYITKVLKEFYKTKGKKEFDAHCYYKYNVGKKAEILEIEYCDKEEQSREIYYLRTCEKLGEILLYDNSFKLVYSMPYEH